MVTKKIKRKAQMATYVVVALVVAALVAAGWFFYNQDMVPGNGGSDGKKYISFDGQDDYVEIEDAPEFSVSNTGQFTMSMWVRPDTLNFDKFQSSGYIHLAGKGLNSGVNGNHEWALRMYNQNNEENKPNRIAFYLFSNDGQQKQAAFYDPQLTAGEWFLITAVVDQNNIKIYHNAQLLDTKPYAGIVNVQDSLAPVRIGTRSSVSFYDGVFGPVTFFDKALGPAEIAQIYNGGQQFNYNANSGLYSSAGNLISWYGMDNADGVIIDKSGNGFEGLFYSNNVFTSNPVMVE